MATVVAVMDRNSYGENTDVIVRADPATRTLTWVPRDCWCEPIEHRINRAYAIGGPEALLDGLRVLGVPADHVLCLLPRAVGSTLEDESITVPVSEPMAFWYPLSPLEPIEDGRKEVRFDPPAEELSGERIHQWLGARIGIDRNVDDRDRIERQKLLLTALLVSGFDFRRFLQGEGDHRLSSPDALVELAGVTARWEMLTVTGLAPARIEDMEVLVQIGVSADGSALTA